MASEEEIVLRNVREQLQWSCLDCAEEMLCVTVPTFQCHLFPNARVLQMKQYVAFYNKMTECCFQSCVQSMGDRELTEDEVGVLNT